MSGDMSEPIRACLEAARISQEARIRPEWVMAAVDQLPLLHGYTVETVVEYRGVRYQRDPDFEHGPVDDAGAYVLLTKWSEPIWRGYSDGWEAIRVADQTISGPSPVAVVDRQGRARWVRA